MVMKNVLRLALPLALLGMSLGPRPAAASMILAMDLADLTARAEQIVVGEVMSVSSAWDKKHQRIFTTVQLRVAESWKGQMPGDGRLTIVQPGGAAEGIEMRVHGMPGFAAGERAVLFLRGTVQQSLSVVGMGQGKRGLSFDGAHKRWMVDGGDRSAAVSLDAQGHPHSAAPESPLSLDDFRRRVGAMVKTP
jgi:hypothetical protein